MITLVDCNSFYASCEQIFRPDLRGKPVIVLSNNDGCIIARSKEAKQLGIPDLQPYFKLEYLLKQHHVHVFSSNFRLYGDISNRVMMTLSRFSPHVEQYSIDEMFLDAEGITETLERYGEIIKETVWRDVRMPVGVGIAPTKTLAKLANHAANTIKPSGVVVLEHSHQWKWLQKRLPTHKVWGIGSKLAKRLESLGIRSALELAGASPHQIGRHINVNVSRTIRELNGEPCLELDELPSPKKQIFVTRSFAHKITSLPELLNHISRYAAVAGEKLRAEERYCQAIHIFAHTSLFQENSYSNSVTITLPYRCNDSRLILKAAKQGIQHIYKSDCRFTKCGIGLLDLRSERPYQYDLFIDGQSIQQNKAMAVIDQINHRYGRDSLTFSAEGLKGKWTMKQSMLSPAYTTCWKDLPRINCHGYCH